MKLNKKLAGLVLGATALACVAAVAFSAGLVGGAGAPQAEDEPGHAALAEMEDRKAQLEGKDSPTDAEDAELENLVAKIGRAQVAAGTYDYRAEIESTLATLECVISDGERDIKSGTMSKKDLKRVKGNNARLERVVGRYRELLAEAGDDDDCKWLADQLYQEVNGDPSDNSLSS